MNTMQHEATYAEIKERVIEEIADALENGDAQKTIIGLRATVIEAFNAALRDCDTPEYIYQANKL
jgi:hypothetical protein